MSRTTFLGAILVFGLALPTLDDPAAQDAPNSADFGEAVVRGKVDAVTVFRGEALVTRIVDVAGEAGLREIVVTDLPSQVSPESLFAEADPGVSIRSIRYRVRPVAEDVREEVRALDRRIAELQSNIDVNGKLKGVVEQDRAFLKQLENFSAPAATVEWSKGILQPATIEAVTKFLASERKRLAEEEHRLGLKSTELARQLDLAVRERQALTTGAAKSVREAVVFLNLEQSPSRFRLRYLVGDAHWTPSYNLRATADDDRITVEYNASIQQSSGEDWRDVAMTLSTATPSLVSRAPALLGIVIQLESIAGKPPAATPPPADQAAARRELAQNLKIAEMRRNRAGVQIEEDAAKQAVQAAPGQTVQGGQVYYEKSLNELAGSLQVLDLDVGNRKAAPRAGEAATASDEGVSVAYELPERISMPSRSDQQLVQITSLQMNGEFAKVATPLLTEYVYNEASLTNEGPLVLLAGPATSFVDGKFVGQGRVPTVAVGEKFAAGFGIDASLRCRREATQETETAQGGNRVLELGFRLVVENFGDKEAKVRILDRIPSAKESEVRISLVSPESELSRDAEYLASQRKKGILRWDVVAPAAAFGSKAKSVHYAFRMEFDKNLRIGGALTN